MEWDSLLALCGLHSTPGDEDEVAGFLGRSWRRYGLAPEGLGRYALVARRAATSPGAPRVLVCAHMDSPGYVVQCVQRGRRRGVAVALGGPAWPDDERPQTAVVKTAAGAGACILRQDDFNRSRVTVTADVELTRGDRICFPPQGQVRRGRVQASFLDNRIGCHVLTRLAGALPAPAVELLLAATASEEFGGFGAAVLAARVQADLVICLDATYADQRQGIRLGGGPVLTLSDASVLVGRQTWKSLEGLSRRWSLPLQTEVYNVSGTDSRAFPAQGSLAPVLPLLVATEGNHSPLETACLSDIEALAEWLRRLCQDRDAAAEIIASGQFGDV
ncbi:MAG: hypothetical protein PHC30_07285 [Lentisphaeria bacterium]|nr:hypothetical protein [Lentisphaeria bacterium]